MTIIIVNKYHEEDSIFNGSYACHREFLQQEQDRTVTGFFTYFYVNKNTGKTRIEEFVPALDITQESGTLNLFDYVKKKK